MFKKLMLGLGLVASPVALQAATCSECKEACACEKGDKCKCDKSCDCSKCKEKRSKKNN